MIGLSVSYVYQLCDEYSGLEVLHVQKDADEYNEMKSAFNALSDGEKFSPLPDFLYSFRAMTDNQHESFSICPALMR